MTYDELGEAMTGKGDGTGLSDVKEMLSRGLTRTEQCWLDDLGKRLLTITDSERKSLMFACTNLVPRQLMEAIVSRVALISVPLQDRPELNATWANYMMEHDEEAKEQLERLQLRWRPLHVLAYLLRCMISCGFTEQDVDMSVAFKVSGLTFAYTANTLGAAVAPRDKQRIMILCKELVIYDAITKVFFSGDVIAPGTSFDMSQLLLCIPYLVSKQEHFYLAFSMMYEVIADPCMDIVLDAIKNMMDEDKTIDKHPPRVDKYSIKCYDPNYYYISTAMFNTQADIISAVVERLSSHIKSSSSHILSVEMIASIIEWLCKQKREEIHSPLIPTGAIFNNAENTDADVEARAKREKDRATRAKENATPRKVNVGTIKRLSASCGLELSKSYIDNMVDYRVDIVQEAIKHTFHQFLECSTIVTGQTLRYGHDSKSKRCYPFLFKTIQFTEQERAKYTKMLRVPTSTHVRFAEHAMFGESKFQKKKREAAQVSMHGSSETNANVGCRIETVNYDMDKRAAEKWRKTLGLEESPTLYGSKLPHIGVYPGDFIEGYEAEFMEFTEEIQVGGTAAPKGDQIYQPQMEEEEEESYYQTM
jgi:hypothetical protein